MYESAVFPCPLEIMPIQGCSATKRLMRRTGLLLVGVAANSCLRTALSDSPLCYLYICLIANEI